MKLSKKLPLVAIAVLISSSAYSQLSLGGQFSYLKLFGGTGISNTGFSLKGDYALRDDLVVSGGIGYYLPYTESETTSARALSSQTSPGYIDVDYERKIPFTNVFVGLKKYWVGDYEDDFGLYGIGEVGFLTTTTKTEVDAYDESEYTAGVSEEDETFSNFILTFGLGLEKGFDFGYIFSDFKLNIPANQENGEQVAVEIPASMTINLGVRIPMGGSRY